MLCTLVIAIGTFPYALRAVATPWSLDLDRSWASCFGEVLWSFANVSDWEMETFLSFTFFLVFFSADEEKKHVYALDYFVDVWFFSLLRFGAMSLRNYCYAWCLRNWCLWQHQHLSTLLQGKYRVIAETSQMTMNYVFFAMSKANFSRWARIFSQRRITFSMTQNGPYWDKKHGRLSKVLGNCVFHVVLESYAVQAWGFLWCFYSDGLSEQVITLSTGQCQTEVSFA
jgi:hypothetical protein